MFPTFGIGNENEKQCSQPTLGKNGLKTVGEKLGTGIPAHACGLPCFRIQGDGFSITDGERMNSKLCVSCKMIKVALGPS